LTKRAGEKGDSRRPKGVTKKGGKGEKPPEVLQKKAKAEQNKILMSSRRKAQPLQYPPTDGRKCGKGNARPSLDVWRGRTKVNQGGKGGYEAENANKLINFLKQKGNS